MLHREGAEPSVLANFYCAVIQSVMLFGEDTWVMLAPMDQRLERVYVGFLEYVTKLKAKILRDGSWRKMAAEKFLQGAGHNCSRPTWTGIRRQWQNGWSYDLSLMYAQGIHDTREGGTYGCSGGDRRQQRKI